MKIKEAAKKLQSMGGEEDTILAHINPQEAAMLKEGGGSGKRNPKTGLLSFGGYEGGGTDMNDPGGNGGYQGGDWGDAGIAAGNMAAGMGQPGLLNSIMSAWNNLPAGARTAIGMAIPGIGMVAGLGSMLSGLPGGNQFAGPSVNEHGGDSPGGGSLAPSALGNASPGGLLGGTTTTPPAPIYARPAFVPKFGRPRGLLSTGGQLRGFLGG